jgi:hypothetical protein
MNLLLHGSSEVPFSDYKDIGLVPRRQNSFGSGNFLDALCSACPMSGCDHSIYRAAFFGQVFDFIPLLLSAGLSAGILDMLQQKPACGATIRFSPIFALR